MDWNLRTCGRRGHATYAPTEERLRDRLHVETAVGEAWRCLRCGDFAVGPPAGSGPAQEAPIVLRGRALRDAFILRIVAVERVLKGTMVLLAAYAVWRFRSAQARVTEIFEQDLQILQPIAEQVHYQLEHSSIVHSLRTALHAKPTTLIFIALFLAVYGLIQYIEAVGLWRLERWGEYFAVVATSMFIPLEIYELTQKVTWLRIGALIINVALVGYLVWSKRLFGARGGKAAHDAERHEVSLLEVELAAAETDIPHWRSGTPRGSSSMVGDSPLAGPR